MESLSLSLCLVRLACTSGKEGGCNHLRFCLEIGDYVLAEIVNVIFVHNWLNRDRLRPPSCHCSTMSPSDRV